MAHAEAPSLFYPPEARRAFGHDEALRRVAKVARFTPNSRLLHLACGNGAATILFARDFGCGVTAADTEGPALEQLRERVRTNNLADRVHVKAVDFKKLPFPDAEFDGIFSDGRLPWGLEAAAKTLRRFLAPKGRLSIVYPVKVGRLHNPAVLEFWRESLGESLRLPRECLQVLEANGFEPQSAEALPDAELEDFYHSVEGQLGAANEEGRAQRLREEIALFRSQAGKAGVTFAQMLGRRKEPGEKPPPSRSDG